jgi:hypothetical protein
MERLTRDGWVGDDGQPVVDRPRPGALFPVAEVAAAAGVTVDEMVARAHELGVSVTGDFAGQPFVARGSVKKLLQPAATYPVAPPTPSPIGG